MKKIFIFACCFILILQITYIPVKAVETTMDFPDVFFAPHIFYGLNNGIEYDFGRYSDYDNVYEAKNAFYQDLFYDLTGQNYSDVDVNDYMSSFYTLDFGYTTSQYNNLLQGYSAYTLDPTLSFTLPWTKDGIASWNRYNNFYVQKYLNVLNQQDIPSVDLNVSATNFNTYYQVGVPYAPSWGNFGPSTPMVTFSPSSSYVNDFPVSQSWMPFSGSLIFDNYDGYWKVTADGYVIDAAINSDDAYYTAGWNGSWTQYIQSSSHRPSMTNVLERANNSIRTIDINNTAALLNFIPNFARRCQVYVNGDLYYYGGYTMPDLVSAPDVILNPTNDDMIGNDIPVPNVPDLNWDLGRFNDLLDDAFENNGTISWDDVIDNDVITHDDGTTLEDDDTKEEPINDVIEEEQDVPFDDIIPPPPPPPPPIKKWNFDFDPDDPDPRPHSLSVLARIVDVTNKSLPEDLMIMFWGICSTLLILGLIKIMHK